jgi:hypothetical protein
MWNYSGRYLIQLLEYPNTILGAKKPQYRILFGIKKIQIPNTNTTVLSNYLNSIRILFSSVKWNAIEDDYYTEAESVPRSNSSARSGALPLEAGRTLQTVLERGSEHPSTENRNRITPFSRTSLTPVETTLPGWPVSVKTLIWIMR